MGFDAHANGAISTVATAPSPATSGTSLVVASGHGSRFPTPPFNVMVCPAGATPDPTNMEVMRVTTVAGDTLGGLIRAQESTTPRSIGVGDFIAAGITAKTLTDIEACTGLATNAFSWKEDFIPCKAVTSTLPPQWINESIVSGGSTVPLATTAPNVGVQRLTTGTTSGNGYGIHASDNGGPGYVTLVPLYNVANWDATFIFRLGPVEGTTTSVSMRVGFYGLQAISDDPTNFIGLRYSTAKGDTSFVFVCSNSGTATTASGPAVDNAWHKLRIRSTTAGTILFSVDGGSESPISTNLPTSAMQPAFQLTTQTTAAKTLDADYFSFVMTGLAR